MAVFQDVLKKAFDATGNYETSLNKAFSMFSKPTKVAMNNQEYAILTRPKVYQNSIDPLSKDFKHSELSFSLLNIHDINSTSVGGGYNNWASTSIPKNLGDQYKDMYDYLMNMDTINIKGPVSDEDMDDLYEKMVKAKKNKTHKIIDYSGEGHNNAINFLNNRSQTDIPSPPPKSVVNVANNTPTPMDNLNKLLNKTHPERRMWTNRDFVFGDNYINNKDFSRTVTEFYTNTENTGKLFEKIAKFSDLEYSPNDFKIYENMFDTYKRATGQTTKDVQQQIINQFKEWKVGPEEIQKHFRLIKEAAEEVGWQGNYEHLDYSSFKIDDAIETRKIPKLKNADKSYRPNITMNGNSLDIDSIYNYSIPKKVKGDVPEFDTDNAQDLLNNVKNFFNDNIDNTSEPTSIPNKVTPDIDNTSKPTGIPNRLNPEEQEALDKANELWRQQREEDFLNKEIEIEEMFKETDEMFGSPEEILRPDYEPRVDSATANSVKSDPSTWSDDYILNTATDETALNDMINQRDQAIRFKDINPDKPSTWTEEYVNKTAKTPDELHDMTQRMREAKNLDTVETINQQRKAEDVPKNRQQKRQEAKEGKGQGKKQGKKSKQQKAREKRQQQFEDRQKTLGRDPEEVKNLNKEMNEKRKQQGKETREKKKLDAEKAKADAEKAKANKARAEKTYQDAMDKINGKTDLERMEFYNTTETERKYKFQQENQESLESLTENKGQVNDSNKYVHNQNFDDIDADINATQENINRGYKDVNGYTGNKLNSEMDNYLDGRTIYDTSIPRPEKTIEEISEGFDSYRANSKYFDDAGKPVKTRKVVKTFGPNPLENVSKVGVLTAGMNILGTITDYKDERRKGRGVVASAVTAGAKFAMYEALGLWAIPVALVSNAPGAIIKGADMLYKENRKMNSAANFQVFGGAQFMDTQQLATMRQSGMEMAKMANYNLQQTLMGNEATYLHR